MRAIIKYINYNGMDFGLRFRADTFIAFNLSAMKNEVLALKVLQNP
jgi:hypothetical protein